MIQKTEHESATRMAERLSVALRKPWRLNVPRSPTDKSNPSSLGNGTIGVFGDDVGRLVGILLESKPGRGDGLMELVKIIEAIKSLEASHD